MSRFEKKKVTVTRRIEELLRNTEGLMVKFADLLGKSACGRAGCGVAGLWAATASHAAKPSAVGHVSES